MDTRSNKLYQHIYIILVFVFLYLPILMIVFYSFNEARTGSMWMGFTLDWYRKLFNDTDTITAFKNSLTIALLSTSISAVVGTIGAVGMYKYVFKGKSAVEMLLNITIIIPEIILGIALLVYFTQFQVQLGIGTLVLSHVTFSIPFVLIVVKARFSGFDPCIEDAAMDLGAGRFKVFLTIILPNILPGVFSGAMIAFVLSFDDVIINFFVSGPESTTLPIKIFSMLRFGLSPEINALCAIMLLITFVILITGQSIKLIGRKNI